MILLTKSRCYQGHRSHSRAWPRPRARGPPSPSAPIWRSCSRGFLRTSRYQPARTSSKVRLGQSKGRGSELVTRTTYYLIYKICTLSCVTQHFLSSAPQYICNPLSLSPGVSAVRMSTLERQLTSPGMAGPSRHLSGDQVVTYRGQPDPRRHLSGDQVNQVRVTECDEQG